MNRAEIIREIEELRLDAYDPLFPFARQYQDRIQELFGILYADDDGCNDAEYELAEAMMAEGV